LKESGAVTGGRILQLRIERIDQLVKELLKRENVREHVVK
jgi:hypothetical protein